MSRLLAIETSSEACSVALRCHGDLLVRDYHQPRRHAELLLPAVRELLAECQLTLNELDAIVFGRGPGSFTSLRIGIGVVQGLAWGASLGVVPLSSLAALAQGGIRRHGLTRGGVITAMDARMDEVFHARFRLAPDLLPELEGDEQVSAPDALQLEAKAGLIGVGNGFVRYPSLAQRAAVLSAVYAELWPSAEDLVPLAEQWLDKQAPLAPHLAQPVYVRDHVADKPASQ